MKTTGAPTLLARRLPWVVLGTYLAFRAVSAVLITWVAHHQDPSGIPGGPAGQSVSYWDMTRMWDGEWYRKIAEDGYPTSVPRDELGYARQSELAFYPLFPLLTRLVMALSGASFAPAASMLALVLGAGAAVVMARLLARHVGPLAALSGVAVYASSPPSPSLQLAYTESLAILLLCAVLLALDSRSWLLAAVLALALGVARPIGAPLFVVACVVVLVRWAKRRADPISRGEYAGMGACLVACGLSGALWPLLTWWMTGERAAYPETMGSWRASHTVVPFEAWWRIAGILFGSPMNVVVVLLVVGLFTALVAGPWADGIGLVMRTWCVAYAVYLFAALEPWTSTYRYLLELFPLAVVLVGGAWKRRPSGLMVPLTVGLVLLNVVLQAYWCWTYLRLVPPVGNPI